MPNPSAMNLERPSWRAAARFLLILFAALLVQSVSPADAGPRPPKDFPRTSFVGGSLATGEVKQRGVLLHAGWEDDEGVAQKWFRQARLFPWPKPVEIAASTFRIRLDGVRYPGKLEIGVFRRIGLNDSPSGNRTIYSCPATPNPESQCRWIPNVEDGRLVWDVEVDHVQTKGHLYVVALGTWDEPEDPPKPVGTREQVGTWIFHARLDPA